VRDFKGRWGSTKESGWIGSWESPHGPNQCEICPSWESDRDLNGKYDDKTYEEYEEYKKYKK
jgi:hypothetical protein